MFKLSHCMCCVYQNNSLTGLCNYKLIRFNDKNIFLKEVQIQYFLPYILGGYHEDNNTITISLLGDKNKVYDFVFFRVRNIL
jgi:hypothetical protein